MKNEKAKSLLISQIEKLDKEIKALKENPKNLDISKLSEISENLKPLAKHIVDIQALINYIEFANNITDNFK